MKIVVIGGSGLIGKKLIPLLRGRVQQTVAAMLVPRDVKGSQRGRRC